MICGLTSDKNTIYICTRFFNYRYNRDCRIECNDPHNEYIMWTIAFMSMSCSIVNLRNKIENGRC